MAGANKIYLWHYLAAFLIATCLFSIVFLFAYSVSYLNYSEISSQTNYISDSILQIQKSFQENNCDMDLLVNASERLDVVGSRINLLEERFGSSDPRVLEQKKLYFILEYQHFNIVTNLLENCTQIPYKINTVLFFYSNDKSVSANSDITGKILSALKQKYTTQLMIYSFDYNSDSALITTLKKEYNISEAPAVILNDRKPMRIFNIDDLEGYLQ
jgi:hypothetical protein